MVNKSEKPKIINSNENIKKYTEFINEFGYFLTLNAVHLEEQVLPKKENELTELLKTLRSPIIDNLNYAEFTNKNWNKLSDPEIKKNLIFHINNFIQLIEQKAVIFKSDSVWINKFRKMKELYSEINNEKIHENKTGPEVEKPIEIEKVKPVDINEEAKNDNVGKPKNEINTEVINRTKEIRSQINTTVNRNDNILINEKLKSIGLDADNLSNNEEWNKFTKAEKLLIIEQASQDTLARVKEIGENRFNEKNSIKLSWNPLNFKKSFFEKAWHKVGKSFWISREEKNVIDEVKQGKIKPNEQILDTLIRRQSDLKLPVVEKNGKAFIEFVKDDNNSSREQINALNKFNESANNFSKLPDSWRNERSAQSTDKMFAIENHKKFLESKTNYENNKAEIIKYYAKKFEDEGLTKPEAEKKAMLQILDIDSKVALLQRLNTNPDAYEELDKIKSESSWGRLVNNENIWRGIYMGTGFTARRTLQGTLGLLAAPIVSGIMGGVRARRKANANINKSFKEGTKEETFLERKKQGKKGLYDDKNEKQNFLSYFFTGGKVNTKEVAAFVDADSQKKRIDDLIYKINNAPNEKSKVSLTKQLETRIRYIEQKQQEGLINYGNINPVAKDYELYKSLSEAYVLTTNINNLGIPLTKEMQNDISERNTLLKNVMAKNEEKFGKKIALYKNEEMVRGIIISSGFAVLGRFITSYFMHDDANPTSNNELTPERQHQINEALLNKKPNIDHNIVNRPPLMSAINDEKEPGFNIKYPYETNAPTPANAPIGTNSVLRFAEDIVYKTIETVVKPGQGAISALRDLQHNLKIEYWNNLTNAPASIKHILNTDPHKLAQEYGMYKPNEDAESALIKPGSFFRVDGKGNLTYHEIGTNKVITLEEGTDADVTNTYDGKMADTHPSEVIPKRDDTPIEEMKPHDEFKPFVDQNKVNEMNTRISNFNLKWKQAIEAINEKYNHLRKNSIFSGPEYEKVQSYWHTKYMNDVKMIDEKYNNLENDSYNKLLNNIRGYSESEKEEIINKFYKDWENYLINNKEPEIISLSDKFYDNLLKNYNSILNHHQGSEIYSANEHFENKYESVANGTELVDKGIYNSITKELQKVISGMSFKEYIKLSTDDSYSLHGKLEPLSSYLEQLEKVSGIKPLTGGLFQKSESLAEYIERATDKIDKINEAIKIRGGVLLAKPELGGEIIPAKIITQEMLDKADSNIEENIKSMFNTDKLIKKFNYLVDNKTSMSSFIEYNKTNTGISEEFKPLAEYVKKLGKISGIKPSSDEPIIDYIRRTTDKIVQLGKLDKMNPSLKQSTDDIYH